MNRLRRRHGLGFLGADLRSVYTDSDYLLYADIPGLVQMNRLPAEHLFIGPVFWSPSQNYPDWWDEVVNAGKPIVYVNLGSSGRGDLLPGIADALSDINVSLGAAEVISKCTRPTVVITDSSNITISLDGAEVTSGANVHVLLSDIAVTLGTASATSGASIGSIALVFIAAGVALGLPQRNRTLTLPQRSRIF